MLRPEVFNRLFALLFQAHRADDEFLFGRHGDGKRLSIARHVEYGLADHRGLPDHAHVRRALGQQERLHFVILLDHAAVLRPGGGLQLDGCR